MSFHNDKCVECGYDFGPMAMINCIECEKTYCNACNTNGHDCEVEDDDSE